MAALDARIRQLSAQAGAATRWGTPEELDQIKKELAEARISVAIGEIMETAPSLDAEQVARLTRQLKGGSHEPGVSYPTGVLPVARAADPPQ